LLASCHRCCHSDAPVNLDFAAARQQLVTELRTAGIRDEAVLTAIGRTPREEFVLPGDLRRAYVDHALPIERDQTISQPYVVARMTELLEAGPKTRVLEIGTGSGYQAAILATIVGEVFTIEIDPQLADRARERLKRLGYRNVHVRSGDGFYGWPEEAPFDAAIITAAAPQVPPAIVAQLAPDGRLVMPLEKGSHQVLVQGRKQGTTVAMKEITDVVFVPMTGEVRR
jgi:protein-L-isoaspartate(D-aspartate) O-methyltransferase